MDSGTQMDEYGGDVKKRVRDWEIQILSLSGNKNIQEICEVYFSMRNSPTKDKLGEDLLKGDWTRIRDNSTTNSKSVPNTPREGYIGIVPAPSFISLPKESILETTTNEDTILTGIIRKRIYEYNQEKNNLLLREILNKHSDGNSILTELLDIAVSTVITKKEPIAQVLPEQVSSAEEEVLEKEEIEEVLEVKEVKEEKEEEEEIEEVLEEEIEEDQFEQSERIQNTTKTLEITELLSSTTNTLKQPEIARVSKEETDTKPEELSKIKPVTKIIRRKEVTESRLSSKTRVLEDNSEERQQKEEDSFTFSKKITCFNCEKKGHIVKYCPEKPMKRMKKKSK
ncbi:hypothetical protein NEOKW01_1220 [Nematocida sp. AWRm80]|nr:hypothetical protein NEOKW01_1220 [Nematocida sp. AWRm80]